MAAAIWSSTAADILQFPASSFLRFLSQSWLTADPRDALNGELSLAVHEAGRKITQTLPDIRALKSGCARGHTKPASSTCAETANSEETFDHVVFATHAPTTLALLNDNASLAEPEILQAVQYQPNTVYLHTDHTLLPKRKGIWSAWNYIESSYIESSFV